MKILLVLGCPVELLGVSVINDDQEVDAVRRAREAAARLGATVFCVVSEPVGDTLAYLESEVDERAMLEEIAVRFG